ncbi:MAG: DUF5041 domain-containing protein [Prevotella sp.]|nr:DUF5041 domain-containing protein [Prevotella sp.]
MNKQTIITAMLALVAMAGQGQTIKRVEASLEDFMEHMAMYGYEVFTYDISSLRDSVSGFTIVIREYNQQGMIDEKKLYGFRTKTMISDFNEQDQKSIYEEKDGDDMERGIYRLSKSLSIGFSPIQSDSIETITLRSSRNDASPWKLMLKPIPGAPQTIYRYQKAPYQPTSFSLDTFIPLVFYGSFWWDEQAKGWRFCGETELTEEKAKTSDYFKYCPHYYIIGAVFHK